MDIVITGASRGIGRALALALASPERRLVLVARDRERLAEVASGIAARGGRSAVLPGDLSSVVGARSLGAELATRVEPGATLVHDAGLWPSRLERGPDGLERAFVVNHLGPLALQAPLLRAGRLSRVLVIGAGLMVKGRFSPERTPAGDDFSSFRTYCTTKLCQAMGQRDVAASHPEVDFLVVHPGIVRTELGARPGLLGGLVALAKRRWESPETCAARLVRILERPRWSPPGEARWQVEENEAPWPEVADREETRASLRAVTERLLGA